MDGSEDEKDGDADPPPVQVVREESTSGYKKEVIIINDPETAKEFLKQANMHPIQETKALFFVIVVGIFVLGAVFVAAGIALVYLGAEGSSEVDLFGAKMTSSNVGIVSIFIGGAIIVLVLRNAMKNISTISKH